ncbi:hypothetical protein AHMF7605_29295 [Adhaeribacter arboris]|uniref:Uncharacterized protein n=1 Tax=Adhaeribacter arboris TaxID=2072846 RepID=A0A2T2Y921_9BACT|nr:hypothetical protein [Adhaeribacter arboris]PSR52003.1 hypothetical protein AHMF7605_29295 [Adhaeribacter arboris]
MFARFKKGTSTPEGSTLFAFKAGKVKLAFCSTVYETLTISGTKARYTGKVKSWPRQLRLLSFID